MSRKNLIKVIAAASLAALPSAARAVVFYSTSDPNYNSTAPTDPTLVNSGWQYELPWNVFLATPIAPQYFVTANHIGNQGGMILPNGGGTANVTLVGTYGEDLDLYKIDKTFYSYAPLYNASTDGSEVGKQLVIIGRGGPRGTEIHAGNDNSNPLLGWNWPATNDVTETWGTNKVASIASETNFSGRLLQATFDQPGKGDSTGANEAALIVYDSGGGVFVKSNGGQWKLAGVNYAVDNFRFTADGANFSGALFDTRGLYDTNGNLISGGDNVPSSWYASRISPDAASITSLIGLPSTWNVDANGTWGTSTNWAQGLPASAAGATADFRTVITADRTVTLSANQTAGTLDFDSASRYTLTGSTITLDTTSSSTNARINVASGNQTIASAMTLNKDLDLYVINSSSTLTLSGAMSALGRTISQIGSGTVEYKYVRADTLNVQLGNARILSNGSNTSKVATLILPGATSLDLTNNDLIVSNQTEGTFENAIKSGYNGGAWNGAGIRSSTAATTNSLTGLGVGNAADLLGFSSGTMLWSGQTVSPSDTLIKYTYVGDMNLDGKIDGDDYFRIDSGYASRATGYAHGDLNFDGKVDSDDYFLIDSNYAKQGSIVFDDPVDPAIQSVSAVPEPAAISLLGLGVAMALRRGGRRGGQRIRRI